LIKHALIPLIIAFMLLSQQINQVNHEYITIHGKVSYDTLAKQSESHLFILNNSFKAPDTLIHVDNLNKVY
jgi:hypothetical protein